MEWNNDFGWGEILTVVGFIFTIVALWFTAREFKRNAITLERGAIQLNRGAKELERNILVTKAQFIMDITERYFQNDDVRKFYYKLDYGNWKFDAKNFEESDEERWLDHLLYTFDVIGQLVKIGTITIEDIEILAFQADRVLENEEVKKYLDWLDADYLRQGIRKKARHHARFLVDEYSKIKSNIQLNKNLASGGITRKYNKKG